jgi:hypothetical protein
MSVETDCEVTAISCTGIDAESADVYTVVGDCTIGIFPIALSETPPERWAKVFNELAARRDDEIGCTLTAEVIRPVIIASQVSDLAEAAVLRVYEAASRLVLETNREYEARCRARRAALAGVRAAAELVGAGLEHAHVPR